MARKRATMVAIAVAAALAGGCATGQKRAQRAELNIADLNIALALYYSDTGRYPSVQEGVAVLLHPAAPGLSPYIANIPADPWGRPYRYRLVDNVPHLDSAGADGVFGTADDVHD